MPPFFAGLTSILPPPRAFLPPIIRFGFIILSLVLWRGPASIRSTGIKPSSLRWVSLLLM